MLSFTRHGGAEINRNVTMRNYQIIVKIRDFLTQKVSMDKPPPPRQTRFQKKLTKPDRPKKYAYKFSMNTPHRYALQKSLKK